MNFEMENILMTDTDLLIQKRSSLHDAHPARQCTNAVAVGNTVTANVQAVLKA